MVEFNVYVLVGSEWKSDSNDSAEMNNSLWFRPFNYVEFQFQGSRTVVLSKWLASASSTFKPRERFILHKKCTFLPKPENGCC